MDRKEEPIESVPDTEVTAKTESPVLDPFEVAGDIWQVISSRMEEVRKARGLSPDIDFREYLDLIDIITVGDLCSLLTYDDEEDQASTVNEWVDVIEAGRLSAYPLLAGMEADTALQ